MPMFSDDVSPDLGASLTPENIIELIRSMPAGRRQQIAAACQKLMGGQPSGGDIAGLKKRMADMQAAVTDLARRREQGDTPVDKAFSASFDPAIRRLAERDRDVAAAIRFAERKHAQAVTAATKKFSDGGTLRPDTPAALADPFVRLCLRQTVAGKQILIANGFSISG
jgi:hypothetical protein